MSTTMMANRAKGNYLTRGEVSPSLQIRLKFTNAEKRIFRYPL